MRTAPPLVAPVFRSDGQARLLTVMLVLGEALPLAELARRADLAYPTAHREVGRLVEAGILREQRVGGTRVFSENPTSPLVGPLREILSVATGPAVLLTSELERIAGVERAFIYGSFAARAQGVAGDSPRDIDVMVIGEPDVAEVYAATARVESSVHRPVNATVLSAAEWATASGFHDHVRANPIIPLIEASS